MVSPEKGSNLIRKSITYTFGLAACLDGLAAMSTAAGMNNQEGRLIGTVMAIPMLSLVGAGYNLEHPFIRFNPRISHAYAIVEGGLAMVAAGMMIQWPFLGGDPELFLRGFELAKLSLLVTVPHTLTSMSKFNHLPTSLMLSE